MSVREILSSIKHKYRIGPSDLPTALVKEQGELNDLM